MSELEKNSAVDKSSIHVVDVNNEIHMGSPPKKPKKMNGWVLVVFLTFIVWVLHSASTPTLVTQNDKEEMSENFVTSTTISSEPAYSTPVETVRIDTLTEYTRPLPALRYAFNVPSYELSDRWHHIGGETCTYLSANGITLFNETENSQKCILFHDSVPENYKRVELKASFDEQTSAGVVIMSDTGNPLLDDYNYFRFIVDMGIGGTKRAVVQEVSMAEDSTIRVIDLTEKQYDYKPGISYTISIDRTNNEFNFYVSEGDNDPVKINESPIVIQYPILKKTGFKITDAYPDDDNKVYVTSFEVFQ